VKQKLTCAIGSSTSLFIYSFILRAGQHQYLFLSSLFILPFVLFCVQVNIAKAREVYRPVATRGSLVYFLIDNLNALNRVYHYSMANFVYILGKGMDLCPGGRDESKVGGLMSCLMNNCILLPPGREKGRAKREREVVHISLSGPILQGQPCVHPGQGHGPLPWRQG
jgi:hypothetical protein